MPHSLLVRSLGWALLSVSLVHCASGPEPQPAQQPPPPPPPRKEPEPEPPPRPMLMVTQIRSVDTPRVPRAGVLEQSRKLSENIAYSGRYALAQTATTASEPCLSEACELSAAQKAAARDLLHTRLVQYVDKCVLLSVLYDVESARNQWAWAKNFACDAASVEAAVGELGTAFLGRSDEGPHGPIYAVAPVQHDISDIAWASESLTEYLSTLIAAGGRKIIPASTVVVPLQGKKAEPYKGCPDHKCAMELARISQAEVGVATKVTRRKAACTVDASLWVMGAKTSSVTASAKGGCEAADIAEGLRSVSAKLIGAPKAAPAPAPAPTETPAQTPPQTPNEELSPPTDDLR